jgi:ribonuclease-3
MSKDLEVFLERIEYNFKNKSLLQEALTHPSSSHDKEAKNYQRLEFLGDTVLSMIIAEILVKTYTDEKEGPLSKRQAYLVSGSTIYKIAR